MHRAMTTALELPEAQVHTINIERAPNWRHGDESQDYRHQVQIVQGPRAGATGGEEELASRHLCK